MIKSLLILLLLLLRLLFILFCGLGLGDFSWDCLGKPEELRMDSVVIVATSLAVALKEAYPNSGNKLQFSKEGGTYEVPISLADSNNSPLTSNCS